jgi:hypothetical protein
MNSCGSSLSSSIASSISSKKRMAAPGPRPESDRWRAGITHSISGSKSSMAASKSRRLYAAMNSRVLSTFSFDTARPVSRQ